MDYARLYPCIALQSRGRIGKWWIHKEYKTFKVVTKYYYPENPQSGSQQGNRQLLSNAVDYWQGFASATKNYYNQLVRPAGMSGYNRYLRMYLLGKEPPAVKDTGGKDPAATGESYDEWYLPENAFESDETWASCFDWPGYAEQDYYNFSLGLPANAKIIGILVGIEMFDVWCYGADMSVKLSWDGGSTWTALKTKVVPCSEAVVNYGGATDKWGRKWLPSELSNANFRLYAIAAGGAEEIAVDNIKVTIYYV